MSGREQKWDSFGNIIHRIVGAGVAVGSAFLAGLMLLIVTNVITRLFGQPIPGHYEILAVMVILPVRNKYG